MLTLEDYGWNQHFADSFEPYAREGFEPGEELTLDYGETYHPDSKLCRCGAPACRVTLNPPKKRRR